MKLPINFVILVIFTFLACTKKVNGPLNYNGKVICYGNGGGFTGAFSTIYLMDNGDLYRNGFNDTSFIKIGKLDEKLVRQQFNNYETLGLEKLNINEPGNRYYFIEFMEGGKSHKIQWGNKELKNNNPAIFFRVMMEIVKKMEGNKN